MVISGSWHKRKPFRLAKYEDAREEEKKTTAFNYSFTENVQGKLRIFESHG